jgi:hypothetical protein
VRFKASGDPHRADPFVECAIIGLLRIRLRRDVYGPLGRSKILEETRDGHHAKIILALAEGRALFRHDANDRHWMSVYLDHFPDGRFMRKEIFLDDLADQDHVARQVHVFVGDIAAVVEGIGIRRQEALVRPGDGQRRRRFQPVVGALGVKVEALEANLLRDPFH